MRYSKMGGGGNRGAKSNSPAKAGAPDHSKTALSPEASLESTKLFRVGGRSRRHRKRGGRRYHAQQAAHKQRSNKLQSSSAKQTASREDVEVQKLKVLNLVESKELQALAAENPHDFERKLDQLLMSTGVEADQLYKHMPHPKNALEAHLMQVLQHSTEAKQQRSIAHRKHLGNIIKVDKPGNLRGSNRRRAAKAEQALIASKQSHPYTEPKAVKVAFRFIEPNARPDVGYLTCLLNTESNNLVIRQTTQRDGFLVARYAFKIRKHEAVKGHILLPILPPEYALRWPTRQQRSPMGLYCSIQILRKSNNDILLYVTSEPQLCQWFGSKLTLLESQAKQHSVTRSQAKMHRKIDYLIFQKQIGEPHSGCQIIRFYTPKPGAYDLTEVEVSPNDIEVLLERYLQYINCFRRQFAPRQKSTRQQRTSQEMHAYVGLNARNYARLFSQMLEAYFQSLDAPLTAKAYQQAESVMKQLLDLFSALLSNKWITVAKDEPAIIDLFNSQKHVKRLLGSLVQLSPKAHTRVQASQTIHIQASKIIHVLAAEPKVAQVLEEADWGKGESASPSSIKASQPPADTPNSEQDGEQGEEGLTPSSSADAVKSGSQRRQQEPVSETHSKRRVPKLSTRESLKNSYNLRPTISYQTDSAAEQAVQHQLLSQFNWHELLQMVVCVELNAQKPVIWEALNPDLVSAARHHLSNYRVHYTHVAESEFICEIKASALERDAPSTSSEPISDLTDAFTKLQMLETRALLKQGNRSIQLMQHAQSWLRLCREHVESKSLADDARVGISPKLMRYFRIFLKLYIEQMLVLEEYHAFGYIWLACALLQGPVVRAALGESFGHAMSMFVDDDRFYHPLNDRMLLCMSFFCKNPDSDEFAYSDMTNWISALESQFAQIQSQQERMCHIFKVLYQQWDAAYDRRRSMEIHISEIHNKQQSMEAMCAKHLDWVRQNEATLRELHSCAAPLKVNSLVLALKYTRDLIRSAHQAASELSDLLDELQTEYARRYSTKGTLRNRQYGIEPLDETDSSEADLASTTSDDESGADSQLDLSA